MKRIQFFLTLVLTAVLCTSCWTMRIITTQPTPVVTAPVVTTPAPAPVVVTKPTVVTTTTTTVTTTRPSTAYPTTQTVQVNTYMQDWSFYLDLQAVAAAYAQSSSVREFEQLLNSSRYMINNLDLNGDGWIDYLRVLEFRQGYNYVYLIQACLANNVFQDVATLVAEVQSSALLVEVIGDPYIYGPGYIVRPVFYKRPAIYNVLCRPSYTVWTSPYHYGYLPSYYSHPAPVVITHYHTYVTTYLSNHAYCHECHYYDTPHYTQYATYTRPQQRQDYATQYPQQSFTRRNATVTTTSGSTRQPVSNAAQLYNVAGVQGPTRGTAATTSTTTTTRTPSTSTSTTSTTRTPSTTSTPTRTTSTTSTPSTPSTTSTTRTPSTTSTTTRTPAANTRTTTTQVNPQGQTRTQIRTTDAQGRTTTTTRTTSTTSTPTRSTSTTSTPTRTTSTTSTSTRR